MLSAFLRRSLREPFVWGERDCALWAANWIAEQRGIDPAASIRGRYRSRLGCIRLANRNGGFVEFADRLLTAAGLDRTEDPQPGDVGVIDTAIGPVVVIRVERGWAWKAERGISVLPAPHIRAWKV